MLMKTAAHSDDARTRSAGLLLVDKAPGMTSHDVVAAVRKFVRPLRVGHTGTLDPLATGLLVLCVGKATKIARFIESQSKLYRAVAVLGLETDTQDITGETVSQTPIPNALTEDQVREAASRFIGMIEQTPPAFSAVKVGGVRAYKRARRKEAVKLEPRKVHIERFDVEHVQLPRVQFLIECSKGTYVRALCSALGTVLGVGGCMESLRRLAIERFKVDDAVPLDELNSRERVMEALVPVPQGFSHMTSISCNSEEAAKLAHGIALTVSGKIEPSAGEADPVLALGPDNELLAVGKITRDGDSVLFHPTRVMVDAG
jgi:tRNA pseudouridine55 synthase